MIHGSPVVKPAFAVVFHCIGVARVIAPFVQDFPATFGHTVLSIAPR